ncbi:uncharacterized protein BJ212DRAFT_346780 [Suillus subaureus]|uniref:Uncharacterized protein n=1 Tax=Suillus subaureus TaxID=48587 RepID=A0A9P7E8U3_9AGAM|nr:uncharacterized protein BJ212DRAFT_346780 [Suillus subaureus]KAG1814683.1 hypothetical protein BJ212DRAFT_346780 [Suillus subaureus]
MHLIWHVTPPFYLLELLISYAMRLSILGVFSVLPTTALVIFAVTITLDYGAMLVGGLLGFGLSGCVNMQFIVYCQVYFNSGCLICINLRLWQAHSGIPSLRLMATWIHLTQSLEYRSCDRAYCAFSLVWNCTMLTIRIFAGL